MPSSEVPLGKPDAGNLHVRFEEGGGGAGPFSEWIIAPPLLDFKTSCDFAFWILDWLTVDF